MKKYVICIVLMLVFMASIASAGAVRSFSGLTALPANDDLSTGLVNIGFSTDFFGTTYTQLYVNNNGNLTFDADMWTFTPFPLLTTATPIIAPFFADVDTRGGNLVYYGQVTVGGRDAFVGNWIDVGHFNQQQDRLNSFQVVLIDRSDIGAGDFDIEFNYDQILWEAGEFSGGNADGLGGDSARIGYSNGIATAYELPGSAINGAFLDSNPTGLIHDSLGSNVLGRYLFTVRNGVVQPADVIPAPGALLLGSMGMGIVGWLRKRRML